MDLSKIKNKFTRKAIKEVAQQIVDSMPDENEDQENCKEEIAMSDLSDEFISKRDMLFLMAGVFTGYLLFHNSFRISSRSIRDIRDFGRF